MAWDVDVTIAGTNVDSVCLEGITIRNGRQLVEEQPEPTTCTLSLLRDSSLGTLDASNYQVGYEVEVIVTPAGQSPIRRFFGIITDIDVDQYVIRISATACGIYQLRQLNWIASADSAHTAYEFDSYAMLTGLYAEALEQYGVPQDVFLNKPDTFPDVYASDFVSGYYKTTSVEVEALQTIYLSDVITDSVGCTIGGVLFEAMRKVSGKQPIALVFKNQADRNSTTANVTLTESEIADDWRAARDLGFYQTAANIDYVGPWDQPSETYPSPGTVRATSTSVTGQGPTSRSYSFPFTTAADAQEKADYLVNYGQWPGWFADVTVLIGTTAPSRQYDLAYYLECGRRWFTPVLADGITQHWYCEGYTEEIKRNEWTARVRLSDFANSSLAGQQWQNVTSNLQWQNVEADLIWYDLRSEDL